MSRRRWDPVGHSGLTARPVPLGRPCDTTPCKAYFVKRDKETTALDDIQNDTVNGSIAFAPLKLAEFIVIKIGQSAKTLGCQDLAGHAQ